MENEVHIFDDIIDLNYQEQIKTTLLENDFAWYYIGDVTNPYVNEQQRPGFQHNLVLEYGQENSPHHILFENLIKNCCSKFNRQSVFKRSCRQYLSFHEKCRRSNFKFFMGRSWTCYYRVCNE